MRAVACSFLISVTVAIAAPVTFSGDIAPIIYAQCADCHRAGMTAPFALTSYADVAKHAKIIAAVTASRYMPPWKAEPASYAYRDSRRLTDEQISLIQTWVKQGMPKGDLAKMPALPKFPEGWQIGTPDLVLEMPKPFTIPAEGADIYRNVVIPLELTKDEWVQAVELRTTSRGVVHHVLYFADSSGDARKAEAENPEAAEGMRFTRGMIPMGGMAVGAQPHLLPNGLATLLPKGSDLVFQYHFHPSGKGGNGAVQSRALLREEGPRAYVNRRSITASLWPVLQHQDSCRPEGFYRSRFLYSSCGYGSYQCRRACALSWKAHDDDRDSTEW